MTEPLIRLGRPLLEETENLTTIVRDVSDVEGKTSKFYAVVWLVEVPSGAEAVCRPYEVWGTWEKTGEGKRAKSTFVPDFGKVIAAPTVWPAAGNPTQPQGRYAVPAYFMFPSQHEQMLKGNGPSELKRYLELRLRGTYGHHDDAAEEAVRIAGPLWSRLKEAEPQEALIVICHIGPEGVYRVVPEGEWIGTGEVDLGPSLAVPGTRLVANLQRLMDRFWWAKQEEGAEYGSRPDGQCTFCGARGEVVSCYAKAWPWFSLTWSAPKPAELDEAELVEAVACCARCYAGLTYGGKIFSHLSRNLDPAVIREIFGGHGSSRGPLIQGTAWLLPWHDEYDRRRFSRAIRRMRNREGESPRDLHLHDLLGFDNIVPEELNTDAYRLTAVYYTQANADIHLHAMVQEVEPGTVGALVRNVIPEAMDTIEGEPLRIGRSFPAWLAKAYGGGYVWQSLEKVLHRQSLAVRPFIHRAAHRMQYWAKQLPEGRALSELMEEVRFYRVFLAFLRSYHRHFGIPEEDDFPMKDPGQLQDMLQKPEVLWNLEEPADIGFVAGSVVREFSRRYWAEQDKDFLKTRVMTFGSRLDPDTLWRRALIPMVDLAERLDIELGRAFMLRLGQALRLMETYRQEWSRDPDAFLSGFWSGYCLADRAFVATSQEEVRS